MKRSMLFLLLVCALNLGAQKINQAGHFIRTEQSLPAEPVIEKNELKYAGSSFRGNTLFKSSKGFVSLDGNYENAPSSVFIYDEQGQLLRNIKYSATINFKLSPNKKFCAFFDKKNIHVLNLETFKDAEQSGTVLFEVDDVGNLAFVDVTRHVLIYETYEKKFTEPVSHLRLHSNGLVIATDHAVYLVQDGREKQLFHAGDDRIFDLYSDKDKLYLSTRKKEKNGFRFTAYAESGNSRFEPYQSTFYELKKKGETIKNRSAESTGEQTPNPLDFVGANPYPPIGNSYGEIQEYGGAPYPHPGVDLFGNYQDNVYSVKSGEIKAILTTSGFAHWRVAVSNNPGSAPSIGYLYAHVDQATIPFLIGDPVNAGDVVGLLENFPVTGFVHVHFARIMDQGATWSGAWWTLHDPLTFITTFADSTAPIFQKTINNDVFAFRNAQGAYLSKDSLYGQVDVIAKLYDHANSPWQVDVHKVRYSVSPLLTPLVRLIDTLAFDYDFYIDTYFSSTYSNLLINTVYSRDNTCFSTGNYNARDFYHIVSNTNGNDTLENSDGPALFSTTSLQNGSYIFRVEAWDAVNNYAKDSIIFKVRNAQITGLSSTITAPFSVFPNPSASGKYFLVSQAQTPLVYGVYDAVGRKISEGTVTERAQIDLSDKEAGIYLLVVGENKTTGALKLIKN